jgi:hypothetical protein
LCADWLTACCSPGVGRRAATAIFANCAARKGRNDRDRAWWLSRARISSAVRA